MTATVRLFSGQPAVVLQAGDYSASFLPSYGMPCASLRFRGEEYVAWPRTLAQFRSGSVTAIPLVHPWGNRLGAWQYRVGRTRVDLEGLPLARDPNGLPIHGNLFAAPFGIERLTGTRLRARYDYGADATRRAAFPFPHDVTVDVFLGERGLRITTEVAPTGRRAVPISFCWHPYFRLPAGRRSDWTVRWPACRHVEVDDRVMPTGVRAEVPAQRAPIGTRTFDDHYALRSDRRFALECGDRRLRMRFDAHYPFAQLYVPPRRDFVAIEPMTATIDALGAGTTPMCPPGETFRATFSVACGP